MESKLVVKIVVYVVDVMVVGGVVVVRGAGVVEG